MSRDRLTRWRLVLGGDDADGLGGVPLTDDDRARDAALSQLYDGERRGGLGRSSPRVARWLGDIRSYFPSSVVRVLQADAMTRLGLRELLLEPELLESVEPDVHLAATLVGLAQVIPDQSRETARSVVRTVTADLEARVSTATRTAVGAALDRSARTARPRHHAIDWPRTIAANLRHYQPELGTVIPQRLVGHARRGAELQRHVVLCVDQSGSMAESVVYASVFGAVLASLPAVRTSLVVFDTEVVDLTEQIRDPVDVLFGVQLGGGTDINRAVGYCQGLVTRPSETVLVLITDLLEGGNAADLLRRLRAILDSGVTVVVLLALSDSGAPAYDRDIAAALAALGVPAFACSPDWFPSLMAAAILGQPLDRWAAERGVALAVPTDPSG